MSASDTAMLAASPPPPTEGGEHEPVAYRSRQRVMKHTGKPGPWLYNTMIERHPPEEEDDVYERQTLYVTPTQPTPVSIDEGMVDLLRAERDEARAIARVYAEHWPYGRMARDEALRIALCAVPPPKAVLTAALNSPTPEAGS